MTRQHTETHKTNTEGSACRGVAQARSRSDRAESARDESKGLQGARPLPYRLSAASVAREVRAEGHGKPVGQGAEEPATRVPCNTQAGAEQTLTQTAHTNSAWPPADTLRTPNGHPVVHPTATLPKCLFPWPCRTSATPVGRRFPESGSAASVALIKLRQPQPALSGMCSAGMRSANPPLPHTIEAHLARRGQGRVEARVFPCGFPGIEPARTRHISFSPFIMEESPKSGSAPVKAFRLRGIKVSVFANAAKTDGRTVTFYKATVTRTYKDGDEFKTTSSFDRDDLPIVTLLMSDAWKFILEAEAKARKDR